jgi:uncharacterized protein
MSQTLDANLLLYASDETSPFHARALTFLEQLARGRSLVYLFWPTVMAYLRIATHPSIFARPLTLTTALANVEGLLTLPNVQTTGERDVFWQVYREIAEPTTVTGNQVPDAHLVALMQENGVRTIWTNDRDFRRFDGIVVRDPFA